MWVLAEDVGPGRGQGFWPVTGRTEPEGIPAVSRADKDPSSEPGQEGPQQRAGPGRTPAVSRAGKDPSSQRGQEGRLGPRQLAES